MRGDFANVAEDDNVMLPRDPSNEPVRCCSREKRTGAFASVPLFERTGKTGGTAPLPPSVPVLLRALRGTTGPLVPLALPVRPGTVTTGPVGAPVLGPELLPERPEPELLRPPLFARS